MHAVLSEIRKNKRCSSHSKPGERERERARERECVRERKCGTDVMSVRQQQLDLTRSRLASAEQQLGASCAAGERYATTRSSTHRTCSASLSVTP